MPEAYFAAAYCSKDFGYWSKWEKATGFHPPSTGPPPEHSWRLIRPLGPVTRYPTFLRKNHEIATAIAHGRAGLCRGTGLAANRKARARISPTVRPRSIHQPARRYSGRRSVGKSGAGTGWLRAEALSQRSRRPDQSGSTSEGAGSLEKAAAAVESSGRRAGRREGLEYRSVRRTHSRRLHLGPWDARHEGHRRPAINRSDRIA